MPIEKAIQVRFLIPQAEVEGISEHNQVLRIGIGNIYLPIEEGKKLLHLFCKDQINEVWNKSITLPNKTLVIFQKRQVQFSVLQQVEEALAPTCSKRFRMEKSTICLEDSEIEKLWNLFSKVTRCILNNSSIVIPDGTVIIMQKNDPIVKENDLTEAPTRKTSNLFMSCFPCRK